MILVQNLRQRLSGNKALFFSLFVLLLTTTSCDPLKKAKSSGTVSDGDLDPIEGKKRYNPKTKKYEDIRLEKENVDTIRWVDNPTKPPIKSDPSQYGSGKDGTKDGTTNGTGTTTLEPGMMEKYNVAILLPFLTDRFREYDAEINEKSMLALDFYSGAKLAFDELAKEGTRLEVSVYDTKATDAETRRILDFPAVKDAQLIIGPIRKSDIKMVANFAKTNQKTLVSPLRPYDDIVNENPFFIQNKPSLKSHCEAITRHVRKNYDADQVVLLS
ncbi:MAG: hypothetical protein AB8G15_14550, partial [Saprospiraceae bacterium]